MSIATDQALFEAGAADLAFLAGQVVEQILLDRSQEAAEREGERLVTVKHVESALDAHLPRQVVERLKETSHERTGKNPPASRD